MEYEAECFSTLARLLEMPDRAFAVYVALATDPGLMPPPAAGHVALFAERVAELSADERQELFSETFRDELSDARRRAIVTALRESGDPRRSTLIIESLEDLRSTLLNDRNPYHHLVVAVSTLLEPSPGGCG